jgi:hypothetical protein
VTGRGRWWYRLGVVVAAALVAGGAVTAYRAHRAMVGPAGAVRAYFAALQRGDAAGALALGAVPAGAHLLLTAAVLHEQQALGPLRNVTVEHATVAGDRGVVRVRYDVALSSAPQEIEDDIAVVRRDGEWRLTRTAVRIRLTLGGAQDRAALLGRALPRGPVLLFPGAVPVRFDSPYLQFAPDAGAVSFSAGASSLLPVELSPAGKDAVVSALATAVRRCLAGAAPVDPRCPVPDDRYVPGSVRGELTSTLTDAVRVELQAGAAGVVDVSATVMARASYRRLTYANVVRRGRGRVQLALVAQVYATSPVRLSWTPQ